MKTLYFLIFNLLIVVQLSGQDIHFSQINASPLMVNPAQTGHINEQMRAGLVYRNQGAAISVPYKTYSATFDAVLAPDFLGNTNTAGAGLYLFHDDSGDGSLQETSIYLASAFHKGLNHFGSLVGSVGFSLGLTNRSVNFSKLVFGNQWNGFQFDTTLFTGESYTDQSFFYLDLNVGIMLSYKVSENLNFSAGVSMNHINKPSETFYNGSSHLDWKWIFHGDAGIRIRDLWRLDPGFIVYSMNGLNEVTLGSNLRYGKSDLQFITGLWYRVNRDIIPMAGVGFRQFSLLFSYDITVSKLQQANHFRGGFEISLFGNFYVRSKRCDNVIF